MSNRVAQWSRLAPLVLALWCLPSLAVAQPSANRPKAVAPPAAAAPAQAAIPDEVRAAWDAMPLPDRIAVQSGLVWSGDYSGALDGTHGRMTHEAIRAFQARHAFAPDGIVTPAMSAELAKVASVKRDAVGFRMVDDPTTGVRIGLPTKLVGKPAKVDGGTRWASADGRIDIRAYSVPGQDLAQLFERLKTEGPGHKVGYAVLRTDWFVIADTVGTKQGYTRFERFGDGVRGFIVWHDPAIGPEFGRVVIATAGTFEAQPKPAPTTGLGAPTPTAPTGPLSSGPAQPAAPSTTPATPPVAAAAPRPQIATALLVAPDRALTVAGAVAGCRSLTLSGRPVTLAGKDDGGRLAILALATPGAAPAALTLVDAPPTSGDDVVLLAIGTEGTAVLPGRLDGTGVASGLQAGGQGAAIFDRAGRLVGLVERAPESERRLGGLVPAATRPYVPAAVLAAPLGTAATTAPATTERRSTAALVAAHAARLARIECVR